MAHTVEERHVLLRHLAVAVAVVTVEVQQVGTVLQPAAHLELAVPQIRFLAEEGLPQMRRVVVLELAEQEVPIPLVLAEVVVEVGTEEVQAVQTGHLAAEADLPI